MRAPADPGPLGGMLDALRHRGPDDAGTWSDGPVALGNRRLSIIDLAGGHQPMASEDGRVVVVQNGELYNHAALREELSAGGHAFATRCDTEVIVHAWRAWGEACLERFRGMFAFALWDDASGELWLARDRIGIKPLYYARQPGRLLFASEIKAILADRAVPREVDETALFHFLSFLVPPAPRTLFAAVRKLPAGTWMRISPDGAVEERRYWDALEHVEARSGAPDDIAADLLAALEDSVRAHKVSDVPVGVFLSGGIDSSTNAVLFSRGETEPVRAFSIGYEGDNPSYPNELEYARIVARQVGAEHHELLLNERDLERFLPEMVRLQDEPIADPVCVPVHYVARLAREHGVKVCHVGEGADELFGGYPYWRRVLQLENAATLPLAQLGKSIGASAGRPWAAQLGFRYEWLRRSAEGKPIFWGGAEAFPEAEKHALLSRRLRDRFRGRTSWEEIEPIWNRYQRSSTLKHPLNWMAYLDLNLRLPELLLMRVDKMSMGVALEARVPYLDHRFVGHALGIDPALRIRDGELKHILRRAVRGLLPRELLERPKQGFGVPLREWMRGRLGGQVEAAVERFCRATDLLDADVAKRVVATGGPVRSWTLFNLALWHEAFVSG